MSADDFETRMRELEKITAVLGESTKTISKSVDDIRQQIQHFIDKCGIALAVEGRVERLEDEVAELFRKSDAQFKVIDHTKTEISTLTAEHAICMRKNTTESSWWKERAGRLFDGGVIAFVLWLMMIYKSH